MGRIFSSDDPDRLYQRVSRIRFPHSRHRHTHTHGACTVDNMLRMCALAQGTEALLRSCGGDSSCDSDTGGSDVGSGSGRAGRRGSRRRAGRASSPGSRLACQEGKTTTVWVVDQGAPLQVEQGAHLQVEQGVDVVNLAEVAEVAEVVEVRVQVMVARSILHAPCRPFLRHYLFEVHSPRNKIPVTQCDPTLGGWQFRIVFTTRNFVVKKSSISKHHAR